MNPLPNDNNAPAQEVAEAQPVAAAQAPPPASAGTAQIHYFDGRNYDEVIAVLVEMLGFVMAEAQNPEPLTQEKLGNMLNVYVSNCLRKGPSAEEQAPTGATCQHVYIKGAKANEKCGKTAKHRGVDGLPKCSGHKNSKPTKDASTPGLAGPTPSGAAGQTFSYSANQGKGKIAPQTLTTIQTSITEQTSPAQLQLAQNPDGRIYNPATNIVFQERAEGWIAIGVMDGADTVKLSAMEAHVCYGNQWKWDPACVADDAAKAMSHPLMIGSDHPLVNNQSSLINSKIDSVVANNSI